MASAITPLRIPDKFYKRNTLDRLPIAFARAGLDPEIGKQIADAFNDINFAEYQAERNNYLEIERWSQLNVLPVTAAPYIVVAKDGTGNFTSIKAAIDSIPVNSQDPRWILVKPNGTSFDDSGAGRVSLSGKYVYITTVGADALSSSSYGQANTVTWINDGVDGGSGVGGILHIENMIIDNRADFIIGALSISTRAVLFSNANFAVISGSTNFNIYGAFVDTDCSVTALWSGSSRTGLDEIFWLGGAVRFHGNTNFALSAGFGDVVVMDAEVDFWPRNFSMSKWANGRGRFVLSGCQLRNNTNLAATWAISATNIEQFVIQDCVYARPNASLNYPITFSVTANFVELLAEFSGNDLPNCDVAVIGLCSGSIEGHYRALNINADNYVVATSLDMFGNTGLTAIACPASNCNIVAALKNGSGGGNTGVNVSGNNNRVSAAGVGGFATPITNTGTGNVINETAPVYSGDVSTTGDFIATTAGKGIKIKEGTNARMGVAVLVAGTVVVNTTVVTANSRVFLTVNTAGGTVGSPYVSARTAGASFTITSTSATDTSTVAWLIVEPA